MRVWMGASLLVLGLLAPVGGQAAENVQNRLDRIERRLVGLEGQLEGFGGADSRAPVDQAAVSAKLGQMEEDNAKMYGAIEELGRSVELLAKKIDNVIKDVDLRLQDLEKKSTAQ